MKPTPSLAGPTPPWQPLPVGCLTHTHWSAADAADGQDPYLIWAEVDKFKGYCVERSKNAATALKPAQVEPVPTWLPIVLELAPDAEVIDLVRASDPLWLQIPMSYLGHPGLRYCSARAGEGFFAALRQPSRLAQIVRRFELGLPVGHHALPLKHVATAAPQMTPPTERLRGPVLGLIDGGLALVHQDFLDVQGRPRVKRFWRQDTWAGSPWLGDPERADNLLDPDRTGNTPPGMGYGHELTGAQIDAAMATHRRNGVVDEDAVYDHLLLWDLKHHAHHGTHVMSQACGPVRFVDTMASEARDPDFTPRQDIASQCDLIAVQLDWSNVMDTSGGAMNVSVLDGLMYMLSCCADDARLVVNISWGTLAGPHDGTSILEAAMDQLIELQGGRLDIVVPAGNGYQSQTHANVTLGASESEGSSDSVTLHWRVQPDDQTQSFLELWLCDPALPAEPIRDISITVHPPGQAEPLPALGVGQAGVWPTAASPQCALVFPRKSALGRQGTCALLALAPTFSHASGATTAPFGTWKVTICNHGLNAVVLDAYIERDDVAMGTYTGARQSYFEDADCDTSGGLESFVDDPDNPTPIRRSGTFNSLSTGRRTVSVGGVRHALGAFDPFARYSPRTPDPDGTRPQRPGVKKEPDRFEVTDDNAALWGIRGAGSRSGNGVVRLAGTSSAAPQVARILINTPCGSGSTSGSAAV